MTNMPTGNSTLADLTPEDWAVAGQLADLLGVPSDELVRDFLEELGRLTPEERAEFDGLVEQTNEVLPDMHASLDRISTSISRCRSTIRELNAQLTTMSQRVARIESSLGIA